MKLSAKILLIFHVLITAASNAQRPFVSIKPGTIWHQEKYCYEGGKCNQIMVCGKMYLSNEDTIISFDIHPLTLDTIWYNPPREYKIFYANPPGKQKACIIDPGHCGCELQIGMGGPCINNDTNNFAKYGFIRQDSINRKVYFRGCNFNYGDTLLYDFNKTVGDTIFPEDVFVYNSCELNGGIYSVVTGLDSIQGSDGIYRKEYKFGSTMSIIEGVGSNSGFLTYNGGQCYGSRVVCVYNQQGDTLYKDPLTCSYPSHCNIIITDIDEQILKSKFEIYPNPTDNSVTVKLPINNSSCTLQIFDLQGRVVKTETLSGNSQTIATDNLPGGVYQLIVSSKDKLLGREKLVVVR